MPKRYIWTLIYMIPSTLTFIITSGSFHEVVDERCQCRIYLSAGCCILYISIQKSRYILVSHIRRSFSFMIIYDQFRFFMMEKLMQIGGPTTNSDWFFLILTMILLLNSSLEPSHDLPRSYNIIKSRFHPHMDQILLNPGAPGWRIYIWHIIAHNIFNHIFIHLLL